MRQRRTEFVVKLGKPHLERVEVDRCRGQLVGVVVRFGSPVARFLVGRTQLEKIRRNVGTLRVSAAQIARASVYCSSPFR